MSDSNGTLIIKGATSADEGEYQCRANNTEGEDSSTIMQLEQIGENTIDYRQTSNLSHTLVGNKIVDHSDVVATSSLST